MDVLIPFSRLIPSSVLEFVVLVNLLNLIYTYHILIIIVDQSSFCIIPE